MHEQDRASEKAAVARIFGFVYASRQETCKDDFQPRQAVHIASGELDAAGDSALHLEACLQLALTLLPDRCFKQYLLALSQAVTGGHLVFTQDVKR